MGKILVVDDSTFQRNKIVQILSQAGYEADQRTNGKEALEYLEQNEPRLVLLDLLMPELDGFGVLEALKARKCNVPVVVLTADIQETQKARCLELGAANFLNKPPKVEQLLEAISCSASPSEEDDSPAQELTATQHDAIAELFNIGIGQAASVLNEMVEAHVTLKIPNLTILDGEGLSCYLHAKDSSAHASVRLNFLGGFAGSSTLVFSGKDASKLVALLSGEEESQLESVIESTLLEVGNIVINGVMGAIANSVERTVEYSIPEYRRDTMVNLFEQPTEETRRLYIIADTAFSVETKEVCGEMLFLFEVDSFV